MLIKDVKLYVVAAGVRERAAVGRGGMELVPPGLSGLFTHGEGIGLDTEIAEYREQAPGYDLILRLVTDGDLDAHATLASGFSASELAWQAREFQVKIAHLLTGMDAFDRERIWQRLWYTQRFMYTGRGLIQTVDEMLWDLASRHARLPLYRLLGGARDSIPAYRNIGGRTVDDYVADAMKAREQGFKGGKDHSYRGVAGNTELFRALREAMGDDFILIHDAVEHYTCDEAIRIGREMERLGYAWIEEPLQDFDLMGLKKLCAALDLPVMAMEWIGSLAGQPFNATPFIAMHATDIVRQRAIGITGQIKLAQLAETFGLDVHGGNAHVVLAIHNDPLYEYGSEGPLPPPQDPATLTFQGIKVIDDGHMRIQCGDLPVPEPDWERVESEALEVL